MMYTSTWHIISSAYNTCIYVVHLEAWSAGDETEVVYSLFKRCQVGVIRPLYNLRDSRERYIVQAIARYLLL